MSSRHNPMYDQFNDLSWDEPSHPYAGRHTMTSQGGYNPYHQPYPQEGFTPQYEHSLNPYNENNSRHASTATSSPASPMVGSRTPYPQNQQQQYLTSAGYDFNQPTPHPTHALPRARHSASSADSMSGSVSQHNSAFATPAPPVQYDEQLSSSLKPHSSSGTQHEGSHRKVNNSSSGSGSKGKSRKDSVAHARESDRRTSKSRHGNSNSNTLELDANGSKKMFGPVNPLVAGVFIRY